MREMPATTFRKSLFRVLADAARFVPTLIRYKKGDTVVLSHNEYRQLKEKKTQSGHRGRKSVKVPPPPVRLKILGPLNEKTEEELLRYMGLK